MRRVLGIVLRLLGILVLCIIVGLFTLPRFPWMLFILGFGFWGAVMHYISLLPSRVRSPDLGRELHRIQRLVTIMQNRADCEWAVRASRWQMNELMTYTITGKLKGLKNTPTLSQFPPYQFPDPGIWRAGSKTGQEHAIERSFPSGAVIVSEGDSGSAFYLLVHGSVDIIQGTNTITQLKQWTFFSESSFLDQIPVPIRVVASERTLCLGFSAWDMNYILDHYAPYKIPVETHS